MRHLTAVPTCNIIGTHGKPSRVAGAARFACTRAGPRATAGGNMTTDKQKALSAVVALAERCHYEEGHTRQVTRLALRVFDELGGLHHFGQTERFWLECAGLLHDIGWIDGQQGHHKTALRLILGDSSLPFDDRVRAVVASIARYHRRALPSRKHEHFAGLRPSDRRTVSMLAGILRMADGLDRTHGDLVTDLTCEVAANRIVVRCDVNGSAEAEVEAALQKGDLLEEMLGRRLDVVTTRQIQGRRGRGGGAASP